MALGAGAPPPAFALAVRGHDFGLGQPLCRRAEGNLERAWVLLEQLLQDPSEAAWEGRCTRRSTLSHDPKRSDRSPASSLGPLHPA